MTDRGDDNEDKRSRNIEISPKLILRLLSLIFAVVFFLVFVVGPALFGIGLYGGAIGLILAISLICLVMAEFVE